MTEKEWLASYMPRRALEFLRNKASGRKLRLYAVACCRRIVHLLNDELSTWTIDIVERFADGSAPKTLFESARRKSLQLSNPNTREYEQEDYQWDRAAAAIRGLTLGPREAAFDTSENANNALSYGWDTRQRRFGLVAEFQVAENLAQVHLLHDIFGNPFRPASLDPACLIWNGGTVPRIAQRIYDERSWDLIPVLADALEEAGCTDVYILNHCRRPGEHVRGCWVVDLILGKN